MQHMNGQRKTMREHSKHVSHPGHSGHAGHDHGQMVADFRKRFWISLLLTIPVLALSPMIQHVLGLGEGWRFAGDAYILTALSSVIYFYGGWPFLDGLRQEVRAGNPGMMSWSVSPSPPLTFTAWRRSLDLPVMISSGNS